MIPKLSERQLKTLIKEGVKEAFKTEIMKLQALVSQHVSLKEQREIERLYGKPSRGAHRTYKIAA